MLSIPPERRHTLARQWLEAALQDYPASTARLLLHEEDRFRNPVGTALKDGIPRLVDALLDGADAHSMKAALEGIVRIRAVQSLSPAQALGFVFKLRNIFRQALSIRGEEAGELDGRIDEMALVAFDLFAHCREQVFEARLNEARRREAVLEKIYSPDGGG